MVKHVDERRNDFLYRRIFIKIIPTVKFKKPYFVLIEKKAWLLGRYILNINWLILLVLLKETQ